MLPPTIIERPLQRHGVRTPEEYRAKQAYLLAHNRRALPTREHGEPQETDTPIVAYVAVSSWRVMCPCGEAPPADPDWALACCCGCGLVYVNVQFSPDREAIEAVLLKRSRWTDRNWRAPWTVDDLRAQNVAHGDPA